MHWDVPTQLSAAERRLCKDLERRGRFYIFLRRVRHLLVDESLEAEFAKAYGKPRGTKPVPPALLVMVWLLQRYSGVSDADAVLTAKMDQRWQLVLGCLGADKAPFSQGVLVAFRERLIAHGLDKMILDRTVALAKETGLFGWKNLTAKMDSSPLIGSGRIEDSWNLLGRALSVVVTCSAAAFGLSREQVQAEAGLTVLSGSSLKAALDIDWDDPVQQHLALQRLLREVEALEGWVAAQMHRAEPDESLSEALAAMRKVLAQDFEPDPDGGGSRIRRGVARDRMASLGDPEMRHGRKSRSKRFTGYKRHIVTVSGIVVEAIVAPANQAEHEMAAPLLDAAKAHGVVDEAQLDRGYLGSPAILEFHDSGGNVICKPWLFRNGGRFTKDAFRIDLDGSS